MHYFGLGVAIYIRESAVFDVAAAILSWLDPRERQDEANIIGACRAAMSILYLHEAFHHKIESFAIRCEIVERARRYLPYSRNVVIPLRRTRSDDVLEEALACAEMYRRFKTEKALSSRHPRTSERSHHRHARRLDLVSREATEATGRPGRHL